MEAFYNKGSLKDRAKKVALLAAIYEYIKSKSQSNELDLKRMLSISKKDLCQMDFQENFVPDWALLDKEIFDNSEHEISCFLTAEKVLELSQKIKQTYLEQFLRTSDGMKQMLKVAKSRAVIGGMYENAVKSLLSF